MPRCVIGLQSCLANSWSGKNTAGPFAVIAVAGTQFNVMTALELRAIVATLIGRANYREGGVMQRDLHVQRWVLISSYLRYLDADRAWTLAQRDARSWFPARRRSKVTPIGDPGSMMRRSYETREEALQRLLLVRAKLERMRQRLAERQCGDDGKVRILLLGR